MKKAVAIKYDESLPAPFIIAKGKGEMAKLIERIADENGVKIAHLPDLAESLIELDIDVFIPEKYYEIIAQLLIFVKEMQGMQ